MRFHGIYILFIGVIITSITGAEPIVSTTMPFNPDFASDNGLAPNLQADDDPFLITDGSEGCAVIWRQAREVSWYTYEMVSMHSEDGGTNWSAVRDSGYLGEHSTNVFGEMDNLGNITFFSEDLYIPDKQNKSPCFDQLVTHYFDATDQSWEARLKLSTFTGDCPGPYAILPLGNERYEAYVFSSSGSEARFYTTYDGGESWTGPLPFEINGELVTGLGCNAFRKSNGLMAVFWIDFTPDPNKTMISKRNSSSVPWSTPATVRDIDFFGDGTNYLLFEYSGSTWLYVYQYQAGGDNSPRDLYAIRSTNNGESWSTPFPIQINGRGVDGNDGTRNDIRIAAKDNVWVVTWLSNDNLSNTIGNDWDYLYTYSEDNGLTWAPAQPLASYAATDTGQEDFFLSYPALEYIGDGTFMALWVSEEDYMGAGTDRDIFYTTLTFPDIEEEPVEMPLMPPLEESNRYYFHLALILLLFGVVFTWSARKRSPDIP